MNVVLREPRTVEDFLAWEDRQEGRHEFDGERVVAMTGGSAAHQRIVYNLMRLLDDALDPARFCVLPEMRFDLGRTVRYPDVAVCAAPVADSVRTMRDAIVLFEVLSGETEGADRGTKLLEYRRLPGLRCYALVAQNRAAVTLFRKGADGWEEAPVAGGDVALPEAGVTLPLAQIYRGVSVQT